MKKIIFLLAFGLMSMLATAQDVRYEVRYDSTTGQTIIQEIQVNQVSTSIEELEAQIAEVDKQIGELAERRRLYVALREKVKAVAPKAAPKQ
jgi:outer membrane murein-binding lipoprotein Lpp